VKRDDDRPTGLKWIRYQELTQFRLFRLLRRRRTERGDQPSPPPRAEPPPRQDPPRTDGG
jgi:hypothetical protein